MEVRVWVGILMAAPTLQEMKDSCDKMNKGKNSFSFFPHINCSPSYKTRDQVAISTSTRPTMSGCCHQQWWPSAVLSWGGDPSSHPHEEMEGRGTKWASLKSDAEHDTPQPLWERIFRAQGGANSPLHQQRILEDLPTHLFPHNKISHNPICKENFLILIPLLALSPIPARPSKKRQHVLGLQLIYRAWRLILQQIIHCIPQHFKKGVSPLSQSIFHIIHMIYTYIFYLYVFLFCLGNFK